MRAFLRPFFMYFLLLCVLLNLGDAPYVDEMMAEAAQDTAVVMQADTSADASKAAPQHPAKAKRSVYENLLANVALSTRERLPLPLDKSGGLVPEIALGHPPSGPPSSIEKPPRFAHAA